MSDYKNDKISDDEIVGGVGNPFTTASEKFVRGFDTIIDKFEKSKDDATNEKVEFTNISVESANGTIKRLKLSLLSTDSNKDKIDQIKSVFKTHEGVNNVTNEKITMNNTDEENIILNIKPEVAEKIAPSGTTKLDYTLKPRLITKLNTILTFIVNNVKYTLSGGTNFNHSHFELGINTFGTLELYNLKNVNDENEVQDVARTKGQTEPKYVLRITKNEDSTLDITREMQETFLDYLTLLNFIIALIKNDKWFASVGNDNKDLNTFFINADNNLNGKPETKQYSNIGKLFGREMKYEKTKNPLKYYASIKLLDTTLKNGMIKGNGGYEYGTYPVTAPAPATAPATAPKKFIESGYTIVMEMLNTLSKINSGNTGVKVDINVEQLCILLAVCEKENNSKKAISDILVKALKTAADEGATAEEYAKFLETYGKNIKAVDDAGANLGQQGADSESGNSEDKKDKKDDSESGNSEKGGDDSVSGSKVTGATIATGIPGQGGDSDVEQGGGQRSKTLKRKQQTHNKSRRRFAYGGRKAYEQRKQKRQQQKQQQN